MISVIIPVRNAKPYIEPCLRNLDEVFAKYGAEFEIVFIDNGSVDGTVEELRERTKRRNDVLLCEDLKDIASVRNTGLAHAQGDWIMVHDVDDVAHPEKLTILFQKLSLLPPGIRSSVDLIASSAVIADGEDRILSLHPFAGGVRKCGELDTDANLLMHGAVLLKRSLLEAVGNYKAGMSFGEDFELWRRIGKMRPESSFLAVPEPLYWYRIRKGSASSTQMLSYAADSKKLGEKPRGVWSSAEREVIKRLILEGRRGTAFSFAAATARLTLPRPADLKNVIRLASGRAPDFFSGYAAAVRDPFLRSFQRYAKGHSPASPDQRASR